MAINNLYICSNIYNAVSTEEHCGPPEDPMGDIKYLPLLQFPFSKNPDFLSHISGSHSTLGTLLIVIYTIHVT